jgi:hypothetical protein
MMLEAEIFCSQAEGTMAQSRRVRHEELLLKIGQCRVKSLNSDQSQTSP